MTVRTSLETRTRVELTFSFDTEDEAKAWLDMFKKASADYAEKVTSEAETTGVSQRKTNGPVSQPPGSGSVGKHAKGKALKKKLRV